MFHGRPQMPAYKFWFKICLLFLLSMAVGCSDDDPVTPPPPADTTPPASVGNLASSPSTDSSATLTWTAPGDDGTNGTATAYDIRFSTTLITDANFNSATQAANLPVPSTAGTGETFTVTGLTENTIYHFALKTADEVPNVSGLSNVPNATTPIAPPPSVRSQVGLIWHGRRPVRLSLLRCGRRQRQRLRGGSE